MSRHLFSTLPIALLTGCASNGANVVSSMNYAAEAVSAVCVRNAVLAEEGFSVQPNLTTRGSAQRFNAAFNKDLSLTGIVRRMGPEKSEISFFAKLPKGATPLARREAEYAVRQADEAAYRKCTEDGRTYGGAAIALETDTDKE